MKKLNISWLKTYWSKIIISLCTVFIVGAISYTVYNYLTPITNAQVNDTNKDKSDFSGEFVDYNENTKDETVEPFSLSQNDVEVQSNQSIQNNDQSKNEISKSKGKEVKQAQTIQGDSSNEVENIIKYQVKTGDTLFSICRKYMPYKNTDEALKVVKHMNNLDDKAIIKYGQILSIPTYNSPSAKNPNITDNVNTLNYKVKPGDTLFSIAKNYMTWCDPREGVLEIIELNKLQNASVIKQGQELVIPCNVGE